MGAQFPFGIDTGILDNTNLAIRTQKAFQLNYIKALKVTEWCKPICQSAGTKAPSVWGEFNISNRLVRQRSPPPTIKMKYKQEESLCERKAIGKCFFKKSCYLQAFKNFFKKMWGPQVKVPEDQQ